MRPRVSICIPTYNRRTYLKETLDSVFRQTYRDFEVIILDDGSTDGTEEMIKGLNLPIRYYKQDNIGHAKTVNRLIKLAQGEYICFLDSDDVFMDDALEQLMDTMGTKQGRIVYGSYLRIDSKGNVVGKDRRKLFSGHITEQLFQNIFVHNVATLYPSKVIVESGGVDGSYPVCHDYDLNLRLSVDYEYVATKRPIFKRRRHASNLSGYNYDNHMVELKVLEDFYFTKGGKQKVPQKIAYKRLARQACRAGKCALNEKKYPQARDILKKSLSYKFSLKAMWLSLKTSVLRLF